MWKRKQIEIPPEIAKATVRDMKAFFKAKGQLEGDEIAATAAWRLQQHLAGKVRVRLSDMKELFHAMKDQIK